MIFNVVNATKFYKRGKNKISGIDQVNLQINERELVVIQGKSGSGKSTLLESITGLLRLDCGMISYKGKELKSFSRKEKSDFLELHVGYVMQGNNLLSQFTIYDNIVFPAYIAKKKNKNDIEKRAIQLIELLEIQHLKEAYPWQLSGGEKRIVAIARTLMNEPTCIVADEPTSNLDEKTAKEIRNIIQNIWENGTTVIISTHDMEFRKIATKEYELEKGRIRVL